MSLIQSDLRFYTKADEAVFGKLPKDKNVSHIASLLSNDARSYVSNISTEVIAFKNEAIVCPATVNRKEYSNALICSPYTTYIKYPLSELKHFDKYWIKVLILFHVTVMSVVCRLTKLNQVIQINNNLNSLLRHPIQLAQCLPELTRLLSEKYPKHAITLYRVNDTFDKALFSSLEKSGYCVFPDRMAHVFFPDAPYMKRSHTRRDMAALRKSPYEIVSHDGLSFEDADRIFELYNMLFVNKHSKFNPAYTEKYFRHALCEGWHHYTALRSPEGRIDAFISWFYSEGVMVCGPLGYDTSLDRKRGLYRKLVALCLKHASENGMVFNMGGGSDQFKINRGSSQTLEYTAVYFQHLPFYRQIPWRLFRWVCTRLLKPILKSSSL